MYVDVLFIAQSNMTLKKYRAAERAERAPGKTFTCASHIAWSIN